MPEDLEAYPGEPMISFFNKSEKRDGSIRVRLVGDGSKEHKYEHGYFVAIGSMVMFLTFRILASFI